jgi:hypothetical protein
MSDKPPAPPLARGSRTDRRVRMTDARISMMVVIATLTVASCMFRLLMWQRLEHTALVFIGIPAALALMVVLSPAAKSATGTIFKAITLALLMSGVVFAEAFVCILFAAPLFYFVGAFVGLILNRRPRGTPYRSGGTIFILLLMLIPASLEGVIPGFEFARDERVTVVRRVNGDAADVAGALARSPRFAKRLPLFLQLGFPTPATTYGAGLSPGDRRSIEFLHGHHPGRLVLRVEASAPGAADFVAESDDSYITHWLSWRRAEVRWREVAPGRTEVTWTLTYRRRLDPAWYFKPLERHGVREAAGYLIETLATPQ